MVIPCLGILSGLRDIGPRRGTMEASIRPARTCTWSYFMLRRAAHMHMDMNMASMLKGE